MSAVRATSIAATIIVHVLIALVLLATVPGDRLATADGLSLATFDVPAPLAQPSPQQTLEPTPPTERSAAVQRRESIVSKATAAAISPPFPQIATSAAAPLSVPATLSRGPVKTLSLTHLDHSRAAPQAMRRDVGEPGATDYAGRVVEWLEHRKAFPSALSRERDDFTVVVRFKIDRRGRATDIMLARTSGKNWLDLFALDQVRDASPFPRPPRNLDASARSFEVPMRYRARS